MHEPRRTHYVGFDPVPCACILVRVVVIAATNESFAQVLAGDGSADGAYCKQVFLGCDDHPITCQDVVDACKSSGLYQGDVIFRGQASQGGGKTVDSTRTRERLSWAPKYSSFLSFLRDHGGKDAYL